MTDEAALPSPDAIGYDPEPHVHPTPGWLRAALICFAVGLALYGSATAWIYLDGQAADDRQSAVLADQARAIAAQTERATEDAYVTCMQRQHNSAETRDAYDAILSTSSTLTSDPVLRSFIEAGRDGAERNVSIPCVRQ
jgi:hypothetical protein